MFENEYERNNGKLIIRLVNLSRFFIYFLATWIQALLVIDCLSNTSQNCELMTVYVSASLGLLDLSMALWSIHPSTRYWNISFVIPVISIIAASNTIRSLLGFTSFTNDQFIMFLLSVMVIILSIVEFLGLRRVTRLWVRTLDKNTDSDEIRTYDL